MNEALSKPKSCTMMISSRMAAPMRRLKSAGRLRLEGKEYIVKDGDIITFRFNV